jgi:hypothetical protein
MRRAMDAAEWFDLGQERIGQDLGPVHEHLENGFAALAVKSVSSLAHQLSNASGGGQAHTRCLSP